MNRFLTWLTGKGSTPRPLSFTSAPPSTAAPGRFTRSTPRIGDPVWVAPKSTQGTITLIERDGFVTFSHGRTVQRPGQRPKPQYTTRMALDQLVWRADIQMWIVGKGPQPKLARGKVITPSPVTIHTGVQGGR